ncbi:hypothetical protein [Thermoactinomyces sp. DSM 45892]|uniref:hypothetical protein n=1 Tax=Thermoactinomyces sp. DSM 45892 TaxID=1882753 RepID=UPI000899E5EF|nr:hypothetical protein [Thermoactinomyces sp. DSM 45892]SDY66771.1 hypothetical protein SAMN05444416_10720 [Thermoactinomyces sp. DSM 45892]
MKKNALNESQLRRLIRKIVQEEIVQFESSKQNMNSPTPKPSKQKPDHNHNGFGEFGSFAEFGGFNGFDEFHPSYGRQSDEPVPAKKSRLVEPDFDSLDEPCAIFGAPEPAAKKRRIKEERPRALPGWSEPYRTNYTELDSPSSSSRKRKR